MNAFDIFIIVIIAFCLVRGFFKGLIGELAGIIGVIAGFYGAMTYYPMLAVYTGQWIHTTTISNLVAFSILFCAILMIIILFSLIIRKFLSIILLGWMDRAFGLVFGAAKGVLLVCVILLVMTTFFPKTPGIIKNSQLASYVAETSNVLTVFVSKTIYSDLIKKINI
ncbi:MAG: CvpA family protein [Desulfobacula sp.]|jgi:membrane protein required for colicin V production|nr:CvpA family protein [Desulfobacula sp.]